MKPFDEILLKDILDFIRQYQMRYGWSPSLRKIQDKFPSKLPSVSKVDRYINVLASRRLIKREGGQIQIDDNIASSQTVSTPLVGTVACGNPTFAIEDIEQTFHLPINLFGNYDLFMLRAKGESMSNIGINDGDLIVVKKQNYAEYGQKVVALVEDDATVKTYRAYGNSIVLHPENEEFEDIVVTPEKCNIQGVVVGCIKTYN